MPNMFVYNFILAYAQYVTTEGHPPRASSELMFFCIGCVGTSTQSVSVVASTQGIVLFCIFRLFGTI